MKPRSDPRVSPGHPKQTLLFFVAQDVTDDLRESVRRLVERLASPDEWVIGPPQLVETSDATDPRDNPVETVGGRLEIYSAMTPWTLPRELDARHLDEVTALLGELCGFSREHRTAFDVELDRESIGTIVDGEVDRSLSDGLLEEWRRRLNQS